MDRMRNEHSALRFLTKEEMREYETDDLTVSNWIADRFEYLSTHTCLPYFWLIEGNFVMEFCNLTSFVEHGLSFATIVSSTAPYY